MRIVVALGGNALLKRGQKLTDANQRTNVGRACDQLAPVALTNELVISHGNGPQVGLLALQGEAYEEVPASPLDVLGAETQGMIGYVLEQEMGNRLPFDLPLATLLTMIEVDPADPAFDHPTKPIGPFYTKEDMETLAREKAWKFTEDDHGYRRTVPSPRPVRIFELDQIGWMLDKGAVVICAGGGGIPTMYEEGDRLVGVEAVIDKDHASGLLATGISADLFIMATDADGVYVNWGSREQRAIARAHPEALLALRDQFPAGTMRPKVVAACEFVVNTGHSAAIGAVADIGAMAGLAGGTLVTTEQSGIAYRGP